MKKLSLVIAFIIALSNLTFAQKSKKGAASGVEPPSAVVKTFNTKYKLAKKTVWSEEEETYRADFKLNDITMAVAYSADGKLLYTEKAMGKTQYNKTALKYITENYAGYKITNMRKRDTYDKKTTYLTTLRKSKELLEVEFDKKGGFIRDTDRTPVSASKKKGKKDDDEETTDEEKPAKKDAKVKAKKKTNDDEENNDEEAAPAKKDTKAKPAKKTDDNEDQEEAAPAKKETKAKPAKKTDDNEDEEAAPAKKETKAKPAKKTDDNEDEEDAKPAPKKEKEKAKPAPKKEKKKTTEDDDDE
jgi:hypothetical protein